MESSNISWNTTNFELNVYHVTPEVDCMSRNLADEEKNNIYSERAEWTICNDMS